MHQKRLGLPEPRLRAYTLFLMELYINFGVYAGEVKQRIPILGQALTETLHLLCNKDYRKNSANLKTVSKVLKVCMIWHIFKKTKKTNVLFIFVVSNIFVYLFKMFNNVLNIFFFQIEKRLFTRGGRENSTFRQLCSDYGCFEVGIK